MKTITTLFTLIALLIGAMTMSAQESPFQPSDNPGFVPVLKKGYRPQISVAPQAAYVNFYDLETAGIAFGGEIALQCPLVCTGKNYIRQQLSFLYFDDPNADRTIMELTLNPEYRFLIRPQFEWAAGVSAGYLRGSTTSNEVTTVDGLFSYGLTTSATWHIGSRLLVGISARQNWAGSDYAHYQGLLKAGFKF